MLALVLTLAGCGGVVVQPPPGTYDAATSRHYSADQLITAIDAVVQTAGNLNATTGKLHLSDLDTSIVLKSAGAMSAAVQSYATGSSTAASVRTAIDAFLGSLSVDAKQHPTLAPVLAALTAALNAMVL